MTVTSNDPAIVTSGETRVRSWRSWLRFGIGFGVLYGVLSATSALDATGTWGLAILAAVLVAACGVELVLFGTPLRAMVRRLGLGRPNVRAVAVAVAVSGLVLAVYPLSAAISGAAVQLHADWIWLLIGLFAFHGVAEEVVWRGYAFRRLRAGRSFWSAVWLTMPLIAATHLPIVFTLGPAVGAGAMLVAAVTTIPFAYLYETGGNTVWAPGLVHTATDAFKLFVIPAAALTTFPLLLVTVSVLVPLLALAVPRRLLSDHGRAKPATPEPVGRPGDAPVTPR